MRQMRSGMALVAMLSVVACQRADIAAPTTQPATGATKLAARSDAPAGSAPAGTRDPARKRAEAAMRDGRMYAPAGDSAIEHWLAAREQSPDDPVVATAIIEMQPYVLLACENAIAQGQFAEARRLHGLMARSTPDAPALGRLAQAIADGESEALAAREARAQAEAAANTVVDAARGNRGAEKPATAGGDADEARTVAKSTPARAVPPALPPPAAPSSALAAASLPPPQPEAPPPPVQAPPPGPSRPVLVQAAAPRYPIIAMHRGVEGHVEIAFTVQPDGSVADARVLAAKPEGVFDNAALEAIARYRFQPAARSHDAVQTIHFSLPDRG